MRNLKRALSLTLASVMLLGMMVVGSSAAAGYDDVKDTDNVEAIEVLQEIEVMVGDERGFGPDRPVNRAEMAVVMGKLLNLDYNYYESACPFTDVSGNYAWAKGWVGAAYANKILSGRSATVFDPGATVTAVEAASMMMRALGYFQYAEDVADGFVLATVKQGTDIGIFNGVGTDGNTAMTRNQVAQMALNALRSEMVTFTGTPGVDVNGVKVGYHAEYTPRTSPEAKYNAITNLVSDIANTNQYYIQLGEQLYDGDLRLDDNAIDDYGRPSRHWEYDGKGIGTYAKKELLRKDYNLAVTGVDMYNLLGSSVVTDDKYTLDVYVDGAEYVAPNNSDYVNFTKTNFTRNNKADLYHTGRGVLTEVYVNNSTKEITVAIINTYLAKAIADYSTTTEKVTVRVYDPYLGIANKDLELKDFPQIEGMKKDDLVLVQWADDTSITRNNEKVVTKVMDPESLIDSTVTKFSTNGKVTKLTTNGTQYESARMLQYDADVLYDYDENLLTDKTYDIYLDQFGNAIGVALHSGTDNYVFITGYDLSDSNYAVTRGSANAIFLDGTMKVIDVNVKDTNTAIKNYNDKNRTGSEATYNPYDYNRWTSGLGGASYYTKINTWYKYTETNGVYTLTPVNAERQFAADANTLLTLDNKHIRQEGDNVKAPTSANAVLALQGWADDKSVFITVDVDEDLAIKGQPNVIDEVTGCYTGIDNVSIEVPNTFTDHPAYFLMDSKNYFIGAVVIGSNNGANNNYAYIFGGAKSERFEADSTAKSTTGTYYWEIDAVIDGQWKENVEIKTKYKSVIDVIKNKVNTANAGDELGEKWASGYLFRLSFDSNGYVTSAKPYDELANTTYIFANTGASNGNWAANTDKQSVRYMNVGETNNTNVTPNVRDSERLISRNERTLYNLNYSNDNGLRTADDCAFVVRQSEYGKNVTRVYSSLDAALAGITETDYTTNGDTSIDFNGTVAAVLDGNARAKWIVFDNNTPLNADQNKPSTPAGNYTSWVEGNTVHVVLVDTHANNATVRSEAARALVAAGYSNPQTAMISVAADSSNGVNPTSISGMIVCDGNQWFAVDYINYWTVKLNGQIKEYVANGTKPTLKENDVKTAGRNIGTGYVADTNVTKYKAYAATDALAWGSNVTEPLSIETGYITVPDSVGSASKGTWAITGSVACQRGPVIKVGNTLTATFTNTNTTASVNTAGYNLTLTPAGGITTAQTKYLTETEYTTAGTKAVFTFSTAGVNANITSLTEGGSDATAPHALALGGAANDGIAGANTGAIEVKSVTLNPTAGNYMKDTVVRVTVTFTLGNVSGGAGKIELAEAASSTSGNFTADSQTNKPGTISFATADTITIGDADYRDADGNPTQYSVTWTYSMPDAASTVTATVTQAS